MKENCDLKIDWCNHEAAKYACENWHYSKCMPVGKISKVGVWENKKYIGCILFSRGAAPNLGKPYNLKQNECVELTRIALTKHKNTVSKFMSVSFKLLKKMSPGLKLIISFADPEENHNGSIYQANNWIYTGKTNGAIFFIVNNKKTHPKTLHSFNVKQNLEGAKLLDKNAKTIYCEGKHRYLMPLNKKIRKQILELALPYPKKCV